MDITTISCGSDTRDKIAEYRDENDLANYDEALRELVKTAAADAVEDTDE